MQIANYITKPIISRLESFLSPAKFTNLTFRLKTSAIFAAVAWLWYEKKKWNLWKAASISLSRRASVLTFLQSGVSLHLISTV